MAEWNGNGKREIHEASLNPNSEKLHKVLPCGNLKITDPSWLMCRGRRLDHSTSFLLAEVVSLRVNALKLWNQN